MQEATRLPGGYSLPTWQQHARRDDCLDRMVPSDLRQFLGLIECQQQVIDLLIKAVEPFAEQCDDVIERVCPEIILSIEARVMDLRRAREAKVEAEKLLNSTQSTEDERLMRSPDRQLNPRECIRCAELRWRAIPLRCPQCEFVYSMWQTALSNGERTHEHSDKDSG